MNSAISESTPALKLLKVTFVVALSQNGLNLNIDSQMASDCTFAFKKLISYISATLNFSTTIRVRDRPKWHYAITVFFAMWPGVM